MADVSGRSEERRRPGDVVTPVRRMARSQGGVGRLHVRRSAERPAEVPDDRRACDVPGRDLDSSGGRPGRSRTRGGTRSCCRRNRCAADVRRLPCLFGECVRDRGRERAAALGATRVAPAVGATTREQRAHRTASARPDVPRPSASRSSAATSRTSSRSPAPSRGGRAGGGSRSVSARAPVRRHAGGSAGPGSSSSRSRRRSISPARGRRCFRRFLAHGPGLLHQEPVGDGRRGAEGTGRQSRSRWSTGERTRSVHGGRPALSLGAGKVGRQRRSCAPRSGPGPGGMRRSASTGPGRGRPAVPDDATTRHREANPGLSNRRWSPRSAVNRSPSRRSSQTEPGRRVSVRVVADGIERLSVNTARRGALCTCQKGTGCIRSVGHLVGIDAVQCRSESLQALAGKRSANSADRRPTHREAPRQAWVGPSRERQTSTRTSRHRAPCHPDRQVAGQHGVPSSRRGGSRWACRRSRPARPTRAGPLAFVGRRRSPSAW